MRPHDRPEDADGRRIAARRLPYLGGLPPFVFEGIDFHFEQFANALRDRRHRPAVAVLGGELVLGAGNVIFQSQQAFAPGQLAPGHDLIDQALLFDHRRHPDPLDHFHAAPKDMEGTLQQHGAQGAAQHDQQCSGLDQRSDVPASEYTGRQ
jgi:hypothetical protein